MKTRTVHVKTWYAFDDNGHCGTVAAKTKRTAERLIRQGITDGRPLRLRVSPTNCPQCGGDHFGDGDGFPVTVNGWYGNQYVEWGAVGGARVCLTTALRCGDCGHERDVDSGFDD